MGREDLEPFHQATLEDDDGDKDGFECGTRGGDARGLSDVCRANLRHAQNSLDAQSGTRCQLDCGALEGDETTPVDAAEAEWSMVHSREVTGTERREGGPVTGVGGGDGSTERGPGRSERGTFTGRITGVQFGEGGIDVDGVISGGVKPPPVGCDLVHYEYLRLTVA